jgi:electron transfer flavoprotein beta subunit
MPALVVATQALGEPRYPSLKGIMAARSKTIETKTLGDVAGIDTPVGGEAATTAVLRAEAPPPRAATRVVRAPADEAAREVVDFLADRRII